MAIPTLLIMAGGTGGHIFPGLAIAEAMRARKWNVQWMGTAGGMETTLVPKANIALHTVEFEGVVGRSGFAKLSMPFKLLLAMIKARAIIKSVRPRAIVAMGGFPALPGGLMAGFLKIPLIVHEQNAVAGKTNQVLAPRAQKVLTAFPGAFSPRKLRETVVGNPVRRDLIGLGATRAAWDGQRPLRIGVVGGSRGAQALNDIVPKAMALLPAMQRPTIVHQCGKGNADAVRVAYRSREIDADVREFIDDMQSVYASVDLMICRSGASTVSELASVEMPAILVPYPFHADQQQLHNARYLTSTGGGILMEQASLSAEVLAHTIAHISAQQLLTMRSMLRTASHDDATDIIADVIDQYREAA